MKNILFICEYRSPYSGNFIKSIQLLAGRLERENNNCYYVFPNQAKERAWISLFDSNTIFFLDFTNIREFANGVHRIAAENSVDIIHAHFVSPNKLKLIAYQLPKVQIYVHLHSDFSKGYKSIKDRIRQYITYNAFANRLKYICVSKEFVKYNKRNSIWIPNAVVCDTKARKSDERVNFRRHHGVEDADILIEIYGWSPEVKGVDIAVEAIKKAISSGYSFKLMIVCGVQYNEAGMRKFISEHTSCTGEEDYIVYVSPTEDVFAYHHAADILLSASRSEGFSYSLIEMLSLGKRCVVSDIPGTAWSQEYRSVVPYQTENIDACMKALVDVSKLDAYDSEVQSAVMEQYSIDKWIEEIIKAYNIEGKDR